MCACVCDWFSRGVIGDEFGPSAVSSAVKNYNALTMDRDAPAATVLSEGATEQVRVDPHGHSSTREALL